MEIRPARMADLETVVALWKEMWDLHARLDPPRHQATPAAGQVITGWIGDNIQDPRACVLISEEEESITGYLLGLILENPPIVPEQFYGYISELCITATARKQGTGKALLKAAEDWFRAKGLSIVELNVSAANPEAVRFWKKGEYRDYLIRLRRDLK